MSINCAVKVNKSQFSLIVALADQWDGNSRWLPDLERYLWEQDIRPNAAATPEWPDSYRFLAGGVDHIDKTARSITIFDRGMQHQGCQNEDGTTKFVRAFQA